MPAWTGFHAWAARGPGFRGRSQMASGAPRRPGEPTPTFLGGGPLRDVPDQSIPWMHRAERPPQAAMAPRGHDDENG
jgi:hypothetical protein